MPVAIEQSASGTTSGALTASLSFGSTPDVGNLVVVNAVIHDTITSRDAQCQCSDNQGNTYTVRNDVTVPTSDIYVMQWTAPIATASGTFTVTITSGNSQAWDTGDFYWAISEVSGHNAADPIDQVATNTGTGTSATVNAAAQQADTMVFGVCGQQWSSDYSKDPSWTEIYGNDLINACYRTGDFDPSWTLALSNSWAAACLGIAIAAGGASSIPVFMHHYMNNVGR